MVNVEEVDKQLLRMGVKFRFWCHAEIRELPKILFEGEQLQHMLIGRYEGGFALFCATDRRVLLIDKKPFYLTLEDIRYDMISDVQFNHRLIDSTVRLGTVHKTVSFTGYSHNKLREFTNYIQQQVMFYRQQQGATQPAQVPVAFTGSNLPILEPAGQHKVPVMNPYSMPVMIRRRVSRFY